MASRTACVVYERSFFWPFLFYLTILSYVIAPPDMWNEVIEFLPSYCVAALGLSVRSASV